MNERMTHCLLAATVVLLAAHLLRGPAVPFVHAGAVDDVPAVLRAQEIQLIDQQGKTVAQLFVGADGGGNLRLRSADGTIRVKLGATNDGSALNLFDREAEPAVRLAADKSGTSATLAEKGKDKKVIKP
jgi:hypothetical protein